MMYHVNKIQIGNKILFDNEPCYVMNNIFVNPGKGQAFNRIKIKKLISCKIIEKIFKSNSLLEKADVEDIKAINLYSDYNLCYFIREDTYEQIIVDKKLISNDVKWIIKNNKYNITLWNNNPIYITLPKFVELLVIDTSDDKKSNSIINNFKTAKLSNDIKIKVPCFIKKNMIIKVNTENNTYVSKVKNE